MELQLYRMRDERYMLDIQRIEGHLMLFLDVAANLLATLNVQHA